jgi:hypothetical protein
MYELGVAAHLAIRCHTASDKMMCTLYLLASVGSYLSVGIARVIGDVNVLFHAGYLVFCLLPSWCIRFRPVLLAHTFFTCELHSAYN